MVSITERHSGVALLDLQTGETTVIFDGHRLEEFAALGTLSWFPCGEQIAFMIVLGDTQNIYRLNLNDGSYEELITSDSVDSGPDVSPCGTRIAFRSGRTGHSELHVKDLENGETVRLTEEESHLT